MGKIKRASWYLALSIVGVVAGVPLVNSPDAPALLKSPQLLLDPTAWQMWWNVNPIQAVGFASACATAVIFGVAAWITIFSPPVTKKEVKEALEPIATKADLKSTKSEIIVELLAELRGNRAPDAPPPDAAIAQKQSEAIEQIFTSNDPLDQSARNAAERIDIDGTIAALLDAAAQDRANAARRYREAGALAYERNVAQAIHAYEQAGALDAQDVSTWIFLSRLRMAAGRTKDAEDAARSALAAADDQRDRSVALNELGDVLVAQGNLPDALKAFRDGLAIRERLARGDPGNAGWQRDLSVSYNKIGDVLVAQGNLPDALKAFRDGLAIAERLARGDLGNAGWQRDLSVSYNRIGGVLVAQGNLPGALKVFRDSHAIFERLARGDLGNAGWQRDLSVSYDRVGDVLAAQGNLPDALKAFRDGLAIRERLARGDPTNAQAQVDLGVSTAKLGQLWQAAGDKAIAHEYFKEAQAQFERVVKIAPDWAEAKRMAEAAARDAARLGG